MYPDLCKFIPLAKVEEGTAGLAGIVAAAEKIQGMIATEPPSWILKAYQEALAEKGING